MHEEVTHTDRADAPSAVDFFHRAPGAGINALPGHRFAARRGPVHQKEVEVTDLQRVHRALKGFKRFLVAAVGVPEFAGDKEFGAGHTARSHRNAHASFIAVDVRRVDVTVSEIHRTVNAFPRPMQGIVTPLDSLKPLAIVGKALLPIVRIMFMLITVGCA